MTMRILIRANVNEDVDHDGDVEHDHDTGQNPPGGRAWPLAAIAPIQAPAKLQQVLAVLGDFFMIFGPRNPRNLEGLLLVLAWLPLERASGGQWGRILRVYQKVSKQREKKKISKTDYIPEWPR